MSGPTISDHAMLRFLERAGGFDIESMRQSLSRSLERARKVATGIGCGDYTVKADGLVYFVVANRVVTICADTGRPIVPRRASNSDTGAPK